jgi:hypothetical protein
MLLIVLIFEENFTNLKDTPTFGLANFGSFWTVCKREIQSLIPDDLSFFNTLAKARDQTHRVDFLEEFFPIDIFPWNISANAGLSKSFSKLAEYKCMSFVKNRTILKVNIKIKDIENN